MARPIERVALRLMKALKREWERESDAAKCRTVGDIASKICKSQGEFDRVMVFIGPRQKGLINTWKRKDGVAVQPNEAGFAWIDSQKEKWPPQARLAMYGVILTICLYGVPKILAWVLR